MSLLVQADILLLDWGLITSTSGAVLQEFRKACPPALVIVLINHTSAHQQSALSSGADAFIAKNETPDYIIERLRALAARIPSDRQEGQP